MGGEDGCNGKLEAIIRRNCQFIWSGKVVYNCQLRESGNFNNYVAVATMTKQAHAC